MAEAAMKEQIISWAKTRSKEIAFDPKKGFYSFDIVVDAYKKGKEQSQAVIKKQLTDKYILKTNKVAEYLIEFIKFIKDEGYHPTTFYISFKLEEVGIIITIPEKEHLLNKFIKKIYSRVSDIITEAYEKHQITLDIKFVNSDVQMDKDMLACDGYTFGFDLNQGRQIKDETNSRPEKRATL